jgi:polysaccharide biosynthesis transport protein
MENLEMSSGKILDQTSELTTPDQRRVMSPQQMQLLSSSSERGLGDYWRILLKRKWTIITFAVVVVTAASIISWRMTPIYDGVASITWSRQMPNFFKDDQSQGSVENGDDPLSLETQIRILQSDSLALQVIHNLGLDKDPDFAGNYKVKTSGGLAISDSPRQQLEREDRLIKLLHRNMRVQQIGNTSLIEIRYSSPNPQLAAETSNAIANAYIEQNIKAKYDSTMQATNLLSKQLADLQIKMETSQAKAVEYEKEHNIIGADDKTNLTTEKLGTLSKELMDAQVDRIRLESIYQMAKTGDANVSVVSSQDGALSGLRQQQLDLQAQYAQLSTLFGPSYPSVVQLQNRLKQVNKSYQEETENQLHRLQNDYEAAVAREQMVQTALSEQTDEANKLNVDAIELKVLQQEADSNRTLYDSLLTQLKEASLEAGLNSSNIRIVDLARIPLHPARPNILQNLEVALLLGLIGGVATVFVLEALDMTVRTPDQIESVSGLPTIGVIPLRAPEERSAQRSEIGPTLKPAPVATSQFVSPVAYADPQSEMSEAYRALRTSLLLSSPARPPQTILFTSALPQDGKTTTSSNSAIVMAQQGKRILLVDCDLRRPAISKLFRLRPEIGLSNVLSGGAKAQDAVLATIQPNLFLMPSGPLPPHPSELLSSNLMQNLLRQWREEYDHIIIDSPPVLSATDGVLLSVQVDLAVLVVRANKTTTPALRRARDLLLHVNAPLGGVVVNAVDMSSPDYYYYSGYGYKYGRKYSGYYIDKNAPKLDNTSDGHAASQVDEAEEPATRSSGS